jgi:hypothetical protein
MSPRGDAQLAELGAAHVGKHTFKFGMLKTRSANSQQTVVMREKKQRDEAAATAGASTAPLPASL